MQYAAARFRHNAASPIVEPPYTQRRSRFTRSTRLAVNILIVFLLLLAAFKFVGEDWLLRPQNTRDFRPVYYSSRIWSQGKVPYDPNEVLEEVRKTTPSLYKQALTTPDIKFALYPPSCFPLIAPLSMLPWSAAEFLELVIGLGCYIWLIALLSKHLAGIRLRYFWAFALAYAPFHAAFHSGNLSAIATPLGCVSMLLMDTNPLAGALLLGVSAALKPQLAALFLCHLLLSRRWKQFAIASVTGAVFMATGIGWLYVHGAHWIEDYRQNVVQMVSPYADNYNAVTDHGAVNFDLFNVQPLAFLLFHDAHKAVFASYALFALLFASYVAFMLLRYPKGPMHRELLMLGLVASMTFISVYQRYYAAIALLIVFAWAVEALPRTLAKCAVVAGWIFIPPASKWALMARIVETYLHPSGSKLQLGALKHALLHTGLPSGMHLTAIETIGLALPLLFVLALLILLQISLWSGAGKRTELDLV